MPAPDRKAYTVLCVDDEAGILSALQRVFLDEDWEVVTARSGEEGLRLLATRDVDLVLSDFRMPGMDGVELMKRVKQIEPDCVRIVFSGYADINVIVSALNEGEIYRFLTKPWNDDELLANVRKALEHYELARENRRLNAELLRLNAQLERKVAERTRELEERNRSLTFAWRMLELVPTPILGIGTDRVVTFANAQARALLETRDDFVGERAADVLSPELCAAVAAVLTGRRGSVVVGRRTPLRVLPMPLGGRIIGALILSHADESLELEMLRVGDTDAPPPDSPEGGRNDE